MVNGHYLSLVALFSQDSIKILFIDSFVVPADNGQVGLLKTRFQRKSSTSESTSFLSSTLLSSQFRIFLEIHIAVIQRFMIEENATNETLDNNEEDNLSAMGVGGVPSGPLHGLSSSVCDSDGSSSSLTRVVFHSLCGRRKSIG